MEDSDMACDVCMGINSDQCPVCGREPQYTTCPDCNGKGYIAWYAVNIKTGGEEEVTEAAWLCLPPTEVSALHRGQKYYQGYREECELCEGTGEVEYDPAYNAGDFDNSDDMYERRREAI